MTTPVQCLQIGELLPHGSVQEIADTLTKKLQEGKIELLDGRKVVNYELVYRTTTGSVRKMRPVHEEIMKEAKAILRKRKIKLPK